MSTVVSEPVDMQRFNCWHSVLMWDGGMCVMTTCKRDQQFERARRFLLEYGSKGKLTFRKGNRVGEVDISYEVGGPVPDNYFPFTKIN